MPLRVVAIDMRELIAVFAPAIESQPPARVALSVIYSKSDRRNLSHTVASFR